MNTDEKLNQSSMRRKKKKREKKEKNIKDFCIFIFFFYNSIDNDIKKREKIVIS